MAQKKLIRKGDRTTHEGTVIEGLAGTDVYGKEIACLGHMVRCPKCGGTYPIMEGVGDVQMFDKHIAVEGMKTSCGATLIASQDEFLLEVNSIVTL